MIFTLKVSFEQMSAFRQISSKRDNDLSVLCVHIDVNASSVICSKPLCGHRRLIVMFPFRYASDCPKWQICWLTSALPRRMATIGEQPRKSSNEPNLEALVSHPKNTGILLVMSQSLQWRHFDVWISKTRVGQTQEIQK